MANKIYYSKTGLIGGAGTDLDSIDGSGLVDGDFAFVAAAGILYVYKLDDDSGAAESSPAIIAPDANAGNKRWLLQQAVMEVAGVNNLKPVVNAAVNKLDIFTKSGGAVPDATNIISVAIPDGNGYTFRSRAAAYLSGTSQFIMADAANYWSKGSLDAEIKTAYVYAIWDAAGGIVWALGGYSGFTRVPASTTETDDDFFLLEAGSTYTKAVTEYCVCVGKIRYQYDTADTPDHTIQATVLDAPQVIWNPKSDYGYSKNFATTFTQGSNISEASRIAIVVKQSGKYSISAIVLGSSDTTGVTARLYIRTGSATYASATQLTFSNMVRTDVGISSVAGPSKQKYLNAGDTIHLGISIIGTTNMSIIGDDGGWGPGVTQLTFMRVD